ncbi:MAG TPA: AAA family ATPase [Acidobacteriota bacterium]|nr:AAA family ATPase [Acidobacteriota bacterium]
MNDSTNRPDSEKKPVYSHDDLVSMLSQKIVGQPAALKYIVPYVQMYQAGLAPEGRPVGVFLLLGPTGTGKTRTVEALAEILHGSSRNVVKIDCGEFQMEHEIAKIVGAPPGYLGHRETESILTQNRLRAATSENCDLSVVLFDEVEKAAPSVTRLLLGILDKALLRLGDNTEVDFQKSLIFFTSNLGAREMLKELKPGLGFKTAATQNWSELSARLETIALAAMRKKYSPEFINRIDAVITYHPLEAESFAVILDQQIAELQRHVDTRLGDRWFKIDVSDEARNFLLQEGTSAEFGARELKRTIHRHLTQPLATLVIQGNIEPGSCVKVELAADGKVLTLRPCKREITVEVSEYLDILIVDDNQELLSLLGEHLKANIGWRIRTAPSAAEATQAIESKIPNVALLDYLLPDGNGVRLGLEIRLKSPEAHVIIMTGGELPAEEEIVCKECGFPRVNKPFLADEIVNLIRHRLVRRTSVTA